MEQTIISAVSSIYSSIFAGMDSYGIPAKVFRIASKMIFAPMHGTAMPICLRTLSLLPSKTKSSGKVCSLARSRFVSALARPNGRYEYRHRRCRLQYKQASQDQAAYKSGLSLLH